MSGETLSARERHLLSSTFISESGLRRNDFDKLRRMLASLGIKYARSDEEVEATLAIACRVVAAARPGAIKKYPPIVAAAPTVEKTAPTLATLPKRASPPRRDLGLSGGSIEESLPKSHSPPGRAVSIAPSHEPAASSIAITVPSASSSTTSYPARQAELQRATTSPDISGYRDNPNRMLLLSEYLAFVGLLKARHLGLVRAANGDVLEAFLSVGGQEDKGGDVSADMLRKRFRDVSLAVDIDKLIAEVDEDGSGKIEFGEFFSLMTNSHMSACVVPADSILLTTEDEESGGRSARLQQMKLASASANHPQPSSAANHVPHTAESVLAASWSHSAPGLPSTTAADQAVLPDGDSPPIAGGPIECPVDTSQIAHSLLVVATLPPALENYVEAAPRPQRDNSRRSYESSGSHASEKASEGQPEGPEMLDPFCLFRRLGGDPDDEDKCFLSKAAMLAALPNIGLNPDELKNYTYFIARSPYGSFSLPTFTDLVAFVDLGYRAHEPSTKAKEEEKATTAKVGTAGLSELLAGVKLGNVGATTKGGSTKEQKEDGTLGDERSALASALATFEGCLDRLPNSLQQSGSPSSHYFTNKGCIWPPALLHCYYLDMGHLKWFTVKFERRRTNRRTSPAAERVLRAVKVLVREMTKHRGGCGACYAHVAKAQKGPSVTERLLKDATIRRSNSEPLYNNNIPPRGFDQSASAFNLSATNRSPRPPSIIQPTSFRTGSRGIHEKHQRQDMFLSGKIAIPPAVMYPSSPPPRSAEPQQSPISTVLRKYPEVIYDETLMGTSGVLGSRNPKLERVSPRYEVVPDCNAIAMRIYHKGRTLDGMAQLPPQALSPRHSPRQQRHMADEHQPAPVIHNTRKAAPTPQSTSTTPRLPNCPSTNFSGRKKAHDSATFLPPLPHMR